MKTTTRLSGARARLSAAAWLPLLLCAAGAAAASPNYLGETGLLNTPTARVIGDGDFRFTLSDSHPNRNYFASFGFLPFLELTGGIVETRDRKGTGPIWGSYGYNKDKVASFKVLLLREGRYWPALAAGVRDFHGNQNFFSEYLAASRKVGPLDLTAGYGGNLYGGAFMGTRARVRELDGFFGGAEWALSDDLSLIYEYDPTETMAMRRGDIASNHNYGVRWNPRDWFSCGYSYQRGERHSVHFAFTYPFGRPLARQRPDPPFFGPVDRRPLFTPGAPAVRFRLAEIRDYLAAEGFPDAQVTLSADTREIRIEFENRRYLSHVKALGRVLRVAVARCPGDVLRIRVIQQALGLPMVEVSVATADYIDFLNGKIGDREMMSRMEISSVISERDIWWDRAYLAEAGAHPPLMYALEPLKANIYWNDPSGFFKFRAGPALWAESNPAPGTLAFANVKFPLYSNIETRQAPISRAPVRSDITDYLGETGVALETLLASRFFRLGASDYLKLSGGYLETQYAGISAEYLRVFRGGRFALSREMTMARKREPGSLFGLQERRSNTRFFNFYLYAPELDTTFSVKAGRFLAGDIGARFQVERDVGGGQVFLWYTRTDTSGFTGPNRGYADKGLGFSIPVRVFRQDDVPGALRHAMSPWSRDVGQPVNQAGLFDFARRFTPAYLRSHWAEIKE